ncbi:hypothetical protein BJ742DRAFT_866749 [Cladochytrium replicatum]|nr:hypothetical protein BJ742DRAFT_866749 [Cladochytrium replicatum]
MRSGGDPQEIHWAKSPNLKVNTQTHKAVAVGGKWGECDEERLQEGSPPCSRTAESLRDPFVEGLRDLTAESRLTIRRSEIRMELQRPMSFDGWELVVVSGKVEGESTDVGEVVAEELAEETELRRLFVAWLGTKINMRIQVEQKVAKIKWKQSSLELEQMQVAIRKHSGDLGDPSSAQRSISYEDRRAFVFSQGPASRVEKIGTFGREITLSSGAHPNWHTSPTVAIGAITGGDLLLGDSIITDITSMFWNLLFSVNAHSEHSNLIFVNEGPSRFAHGFRF